MSTTDERDTLRERIAFEVFHECEFGDDDQESSRLAWERAKSEYTSAARPAFAAADRILSLLDSPVGEPEPDAWLVEVEDDEGWHRAAVRLDEVSARDTCKTWPSPLRVIPLYRRSKLHGAVINEPPPDHERS